MGNPGFYTIINPPSEEDFVIEMNDLVADIDENTSNKNKEVSKESFPSFLESSSDEVWEPSVSSTYLNRMDRHSLLHLSKYDIEVGDTVMISIDFDSNTNTKKLKLSSFFSKPSQVTEILSNNRIKIKNEQGEETVHLSRVKK
ncbi:hypothetical protein NGRA_2619 [Nosema granulosis]|uniref:Uncharacterized protein n=1 Tax=Nosema granulosis TaxID=83296 RepID=A0A9P6KY12_9MICR|nr:hypothetical protein NGRA_2619 [Nosema granulosis]